MKKLQFYDVKTKKKFSTDKYDVEESNGRYFAVADSPHSMNKAYRAIKAEDVS